MRYMLLVYSPEAAWTNEEWTACAVESTEVCRDLHQKGQFIAASPLHPVATAVSVRVRDGVPMTTAGPFAETTEQLGGFFLIEVPDLDEAIQIASRLPSARKGTVEIRPILPLADLPTEHWSPLPSGAARYMFLCYDDEQAWREAGEPALQSAMQEAVRLTHRLAARGQYLSASPLRAPTYATSIRIREGRRQVTDGPFAETREVLGGYYVITARTLDDAAAIAREHPGARRGTVEVRRLFDLPDLPAAS